MRGALSWSLDERDASRIDQALNLLVEETGALQAMVVDRTGQLIASARGSSDLDLLGFAALAAADFAANEQLAALLGEASFSSLSHQGPDISLHLAAVTSQGILAVAFRKDVALGLVRVRVKRALPALRGLLETTLSAAPVERRRALGDVWQHAAEGELERFFGGA